MKKSLLFSLILSIILLGACKKKPDPEPKTTYGYSANIYKFIYEVMNDIYYWSYTVPQNLDLNQYTSPFDLFEELKYHQEDRFSYLFKNGKKVEESIVSGKSIDYGCRFRRDADKNLRVSYVYPNTPAFQSGLKRGFIIKKINGVETPEDNKDINLTQQVEFEVVAHDSTESTISVTAADIKVNGIVKTEVIDHEGKKIGYMVYNSFVGDDPSIAAITDAMATLKSANVDEMVLDLRYNGGGSVKASQHLASHLCPSNAVGKTFVQQTFNEKYTKYNEVMKFEEKANRLNLSRIFVIVTGSTASASELIINSLTPFMDVYLIGSKTVGKNVGSIPILNEPEDYLILPICFTSKNADGFSDYGKGFDPNFEMGDDLSHDFGDKEEACLKSALHYIDHGTFSRSTSRQIQISLEGQKPIGFAVDMAPNTMIDFSKSMIKQ